MVAPPRGLPRALAPAAAALAAAATGRVDGPGALAATGPLLPALAFLAAAVPLAVLLDRTGAVEAVAARTGGGRHLLGRAWLLAALVTAVLNLDAAVVLLTPLYLRVADRTGTDRLTLAAIPVLQASLASSPLPVSNLTNLIVVESAGVGSGDVLRELGLATLAAVAVGWLLFARWAAGRPAPPPAPAPAAGPPLGWTRQAVLGAVVAVVCGLGFAAGEHVGVASWQVAAVGVAVLAAAGRHVPVRAVPVDAVVLVLALGVLVAAVAPSPALPSGGAAHDQAVAALAGVGGAVLANNLPAVLVGLPAMDLAPCGAGWAFLLGVNAGPVLALWASLAALLWVSACRGLGLAVGAGAYHRVGWAVGGPALVAAVAVRAAQTALGPGCGPWW